MEQLIEKYELERSGSANIFARQFTKLGGLAGIIACVGEDLFENFALERLRILGVDILLVKRHPNLKTGLGVALSEPNDRTIVLVQPEIECGHFL